MLDTYHYFSLIDAETPKVSPRAELGWESYYTLEEIYAWLDDLLEQYPTILTPHLVGYSYEGREIRAVKLSHREVASLSIINLFNSISNNCGTYLG